MNRPQHVFPSEAELMVMPIHRIRNLDIWSGDEEKLVQGVLDRRIVETSPDDNRIYRTDVPDMTESNLLKNPNLEKEWQAILDERQAKLKPQIRADEAPAEAPVESPVETPTETIVDPVVVPEVPVETPITIGQELSARFCQQCDSKGVRHRKYCPVFK